jgi:hypothetical protein
VSFARRGQIRIHAAEDHVVAVTDGTVARFEIDVKHPNYVLPERTTGFLRVTISQAGGAPAQPTRELRPPVRVVPAKPVTGILQSHDGRPAPGVRIYAFSSAPVPQPVVPQPERDLLPAQGARLQSRLAEARQSFQTDTITDDQGCFELLVPANGETLLSIWPAKDYALSSQYIADQRGDIGTITLKPGRTLAGYVLDAQDRPLAGVNLYAQLRPDLGSAVAGRKGEGASSAAYPIRVATDPSTSALVQQHASIWRATATDAQGKFAFAPLPPGEYMVEPRDAASDLTTEHRHDPWGPRTVNQRLVPSIRGQINGFDFYAKAKMEADGTFKFTVPRGLVDGVVRLNPLTAIAAPVSRVSAAAAATRSTPPKWRIGKDKPLIGGNEIPLGNVDADIQDIEIIYPDLTLPERAAPAQPQRPARADGGGS